MKYSKKQWIKTIIAVAFVLAILGIAWKFRPEPAPAENVIESAESTQELPSNETQTDEQNEIAVEEPDTVQTPPPEEPEPVWPVTYANDEAASLTVVVNKKHRLASSFAPSLQSVAGGQMRPEAAGPMQQLLDAASSAGNPMIIVSSYRSYQTQVSTYQYWVDTQGQAQADRESARPGHSEHQTGLAADLGNPDGSCRLLACFGTGAAGKWLAAHAHEYGFIIRYPEGLESETGYI